MKKIFVFSFLFLLGWLVYYFYPEYQLPKNSKIDAMIVYKSKHQLLAFSKGKLIKTYTISLGRNPVGAKEYEGDQKTPEGMYSIHDKNPNSGWHKNLGISYPNQNDMAKAKRLGKPAGGDIKIHGLKNRKGYIGKFHRWQDWTLGCIAVTNTEIDELYAAVSVGCTIEIKP
ncbi:L,D-transpeptidase family protein [Flavobacterium chungnamense]|uniref:L,D-transpeptidase family protein n=2 Tax=Flavobacterium chungnamense TaxID=706182 RepID=A0ABP7UUU2_9FLAO